MSLDAFGTVLFKGFYKTDSGFILWGILLHTLFFLQVSVFFFLPICLFFTLFIKIWLTYNVVPISTVGNYFLIPPDFVQACRANSITKHQTLSVSVQVL